MTKFNVFNATLIASVVSLSAMTFSVQASECKGLDNESCSANAACGWVDSYVRKDGREVNAFCRTSTKGSVKAGNVKASNKDDKVNKASS